MAFRIADRVRQTTTTTGTGTLSLGGAETGFRTLSSAIGTGNTCPYLITDNVVWEVGIGTVVSGVSFSRDTVLASSNSNNLVNFGVGVKTVAVVHTAELAPLLSLVGPWTAQQYAVQVTLTDATTIAWNLDLAQAATVTLGGNRTLGNPTNMKAGGTYTLIVIQDGTGSRTLGYGSAYKWPGAITPVLTTAANAVDILTFLSDGTNMYGVVQTDFS